MQSTGSNVIRPEHFGRTWGRGKQSPPLPQPSGLSIDSMFAGYWSWDLDSLLSAYGPPKSKSGNIFGASVYPESLVALRRETKRLLSMQISTLFPETTSAGSKASSSTWPPSAKPNAGPSTSSSSTKVSPSSQTLLSDSNPFGDCEGYLGDAGSFPDRRCLTDTRISGPKSTWWMAANAWASRTLHSLTSIFAKK